MHNDLLQCFVCPSKLWAFCVLSSKVIADLSNQRYKRQHHLHTLLQYTSIWKDAKEIKTNFKLDILNN